MILAKGRCLLSNIRKFNVSVLSIGGEYRSIGSHNVHHNVHPNLLPYLERKCAGNEGRTELVDGFNLLKVKLSDHNELHSLIQETKDNELKDVAELELESLNEEIEEVVEEISDQLVPPEKYDGENAVIEVVPGAGGQEASLFAEEIFQLYIGYVRSLGFQVEVIEMVTQNLAGQSKGIMKGVVSVEGDHVFSILKYECGVHRVQRVPITGTKNDRVQTSTCSVAVLPAPRNIAVDISMKDSSLKWEFMRASGAGGQGVNTTDSAVRLTHIPSNTVVESQEERSQILNRNLALKKLKNILYQRQYDRDQDKVVRNRRQQIGNMDRNEKIRTYNFNRHAITEHRLSQTRSVPNLTGWLSGQYGYEILEDLSVGLKLENRKDKLNQILSHV